MIKNKKNHKNIYPSYVSKLNSERESQIILLKSSDNEKLHYLEVTKLSALLRVIKSEHEGKFYFLNCLNFFKKINQTWTTWKSMKKIYSICKNL